MNANERIIAGCETFWVRVYTYRVDLYLGALLIVCSANYCKGRAGETHGLRRRAKELFESFERLIKDSALATNLLIGS